MQSCSVLPPPPAILGAASVGLALDGLDEFTLAVPPAVKVVVTTGGESGAMTCTWVAGLPMAEAGGAAGAVGAGGRVDPDPVPMAEIPPGDTLTVAAAGPAGVKPAGVALLNDGVVVLSCVAMPPRA